MAKTLLSLTHATVFRFSFSYFPMYHKAYGIIETLAPLHVGASAGEETGNLNRLQSRKGATHVLKNTTY